MAGLSHLRAYGVGVEQYWRGRGERVRAGGMTMSTCSLARVACEFCSRSIAVPGYDFPGSGWLPGPPPPIFRMNAIPGAARPRPSCRARDRVQMDVSPTFDPPAHPTASGNIDRLTERHCRHHRKEPARHDGPRSASTVRGALTRTGVDR